MIQTSTPIKTISGYTGYLFCDIENEQAVRNLFNYDSLEEHKNNKLQMEIKIKRSRKYEGDDIINYYKVTVNLCEYQHNYVHAHFMAHINYEEEIIIPPKEYITMRKMIDFMDNLKEHVDELIEKFNKTQSTAIKIKKN